LTFDFSAEIDTPVTPAPGNFYADFGFSTSFLHLYEPVCNRQADKRTDRYNATD